MTTNLIPVFQGELEGRAQQLCDARDLHQFMQVGRDFSNWIKGRIEQYGFIEGEDFYSVLSPSSDEKNGFCSPDLASKSERRGGHNRTDYHLTLDMAKELAMVENNDQGRQVRRYFIAMERQARESRGASYLSMNHQLAMHRQIPKLIAQLKAETVPAIRATLYAQLTQHCHQLAIPAPAMDCVGRSVQPPPGLFDDKV